MLTLSKKSRFESAHRLGKGYVGKCANIHGHSWNGEIIINWSNRNLDQFDMALDYKEIGAWCKKIEEHLDHKLILCIEDKELYDLCEKNGWAIAWMEENPTSEAIAMSLHSDACGFFSKWGIDPDEITIVINETCTTECRYNHPPQNKLP